MKKIFLLLCFLGIAFPYYYLIKYLEDKNWVWSLSDFFAEANSNYASSMLSADLGVAALSFFIFIIYSFYKKPIKILKYIRLPGVGELGGDGGFTWDIMS